MVISLAWLYYKLPSFTDFEKTLAREIRIIVYELSKKGDELQPGHQFNHPAA
jgi:predicted TIM-barrel fold metal-dependent hydrolase